MPIGASRLQSGWQILRDLEPEGTRGIRKQGKRGKGPPAPRPTESLSGGEPLAPTRVPKLQEARGAGGRPSPRGWARCLHWPPARILPTVQTGCRALSTQDPGVTAGLYAPASLLHLLTCSTCLVVAQVTLLQGAADDSPGFLPREPEDPGLRSLVRHRHYRSGLVWLPPPGLGGARSPLPCTPPTHACRTHGVSTLNWC